MSETDDVVVLKQRCSSLETQVQILKQEIADLYAKKSLNQRNKLIAFLYILMRDAAPTGEIVRAIRMVKGMNSLELSPQFTSKELQAYAERLILELEEQ